jgi:hypothetical protein
MNFVNISRNSIWIQISQVQKPILTGKPIEITHQLVDFVNKSVDLNDKSVDLNDKSMKTSTSGKRGLDSAKHSSRVRRRYRGHPLHHIAIDFDKTLFATRARANRSGSSSGRHAVGATSTPSRPRREGTSAWGRRAEAG